MNKLSSKARSLTSHMLDEGSSTSSIYRIRDIADQYGFQAAGRCRQVLPYGIPVAMLAAFTPKTEPCGSFKKRAQ